MYSFDGSGGGGDSREQNGWPCGADGQCGGRRATETAPSEATYSSRPGSVAPVHPWPRGGVLARLPRSGRITYDQKSPHTKSGTLPTPPGGALRRPERCRIPPRRPSSVGLIFRPSWRRSTQQGSPEGLRPIQRGPKLDRRAAHRPQLDPRASPCSSTRHLPTATACLRPLRIRRAREWRRCSGAAGACERPTCVRDRSAPRGAPSRRPGSRPSTLIWCRIVPARHDLGSPSAPASGRCITSRCTRPSRSYLCHASASNIDGRAPHWHLRVARSQNHLWLQARRRLMMELVR